MKKIPAFKCEHCCTIYEDEQQAMTCEQAHSRKLEIVDTQFSPSKPIPSAVLVEVTTENGTSINAIWYYR
jgi:hypothetical protein